MRFEDFVLQFDASSRGGYRARVLKSPFGEGTAGFTLPTPAGPTSHGASGPTRHLVLAGTPASLGGPPPQELGADLYRQVFQGQVRMLLDKTRGQLERSADLGLRIKIKLDPSDAETGSLADLPWELLCDENEDFFALSRQTSLVRYLDVPRSSQPIAFTAPLRILAVGASPSGLDPLDLEEERQRLLELNRKASGVEVEFLPHVSAGALREALAGDTFHVLHFMGHGTFDPTSGEGMLAFEAADGSADLLSGRAFATKLRDLRSLGVVVLNACDTARARHQDGSSPFRGVATALVLGGLPAVVAMQRPISDRAAIGFSTAFYRHLARGDSIDEALTEGRQAIHSAAPEGFEWATPVLFLRIPEGNVFVAKAVERQEEPPPPAVVPAALLPPEPRGTSSSRRGPALKIGAGAAGAALLATVVYVGAQYAQGKPRGTADNTPVQPISPPTTDLVPSPAQQGNGGTGNRKPAPTAPSHQEKQPDSSIGKPDGTHIVTNPAPPPVVPPKPEAKPVATADLSSLTAQVVSIARRDTGGLRVTVSFKSSAGGALSAVLDRDSSELTDDQGQRYSIMGSDLPAADAGPRLDVASGGSSRHTFDFQAPKVGSTKFYLTLAAADGRPLKVLGSPITLEGPP